jgi:uncharacterized protein
MIVLSDASPLINFAVIGYLDLLPKIFGRVVIPQTVFEEITVHGEGMTGAKEIQNADWVEVKSATNQTLLLALRNQIDPGEAESIVLALELSADLLLMDERLGRRIAKEFQLAVTGTLGLLMDAKRFGHIPSVKPLLDKLIQTNGFRISQQLYDEVLQSAGE